MTPDPTTLADRVDLDELWHILSRAYALWRSFTPEERATETAAMRGCLVSIEIGRDDDGALHVAVHRK